MTDHRFDQHKTHALIGPNREACWDPPRFLARLGIQPGASRPLELIGKFLHLIFRFTRLDGDNHQPVFGMIVVKSH